MRCLVPPPRGRRHLETPEVNALATQAGVRDGILCAAGLEREQVSATPSADVFQAAAFTKEAASFPGVRILGAELGHAVR